MPTINVQIQQDDIKYPIVIGRNLLKDIVEICNLKVYSKILIITDQNLQKSNWLTKILISVSSSEICEVKTLVLLPGENYKNLDSLSLIWQKLTENNFDRKSLVINLGGGVIGDMGAMAASTYQRGIDFVQIPTTLLSMVDASVGGKLGINYGGLKNNIGIFAQPKSVIVDIDFLSTLPEREFVSGFAEIIKHGIINSKVHFDQLRSLGETISKPIDSSNDLIDQYSSSSVQNLGIQSITYKKPSEWKDQELIDLITSSIQIKTEIITQDQKESGIRKILNFGHTLGHAFETIALTTSQPILHGEAVSLGIIAESYLSYLLDKISIIEFGEIYETIKELGLVSSLKDYNWANDQFFLPKVISLIQKDKKNNYGSVNWSLIEGISKGVFDIKVTDETLIESTIDFLKSE